MNYCHTRVEALAEALRSLWQRPLASLLLLGAGAGALCLMIVLLVVADRAAALATPVWMRAEALVLVAGAEGATDLSAMRTALHRIEPVESVDFVGRDAALARLTQRKDLAPLGLAELRPNPLPDAFVVRMAAGAAPDAVDAAVAQLGRAKDVERVVYEPAAYRKAHALMQLGGRLLLLLVCAGAAAVVVGLRLAAGGWLRADRELARVLDMLGADSAAIRRPYVYAGALRMLLAAALAWWLALALGGWIAPDLAAAAREYAVPLDLAALPAWMGGAFCAGAALLGALIASLEVRLALAGAAP